MTNFAAVMDMATPEISIIIPVYNMERYLRQCLDSALAQTFGSWECILVDDGSTDSSRDIIREYEARDSRFRAVFRENGGLSAARNSGLAVARGRYVGFADSDDWLEPRMLEVLHGLITDHDADMAQVGFFKEYDGITHVKPLVRELRALDHHEFVVQLFYDKILPSYMWNKLFRREVVAESFPEGMVFEDIVAMSHWAPNIRKAVLSPVPLYHYRYRKGSIAHTTSATNRLQYLQACIRRAELFEATEPGFIDRRSRDKILWKSALSCGKTIARMTKLPKAERLAALGKVKKECLDNLSAPAKSALGSSRYKKIKLMLDHPNLFILKSVALHGLDFHSRYRISRAYD